MARTCSGATTDRVVQRGWIFADVSAATSMDVPMSAMGIAIGDYNRKGVLNFFVTNTKSGCPGGCVVQDNVHAPTTTQ